jgi:hypothetical protein
MITLFALGALAIFFGMVGVGCWCFYRAGRDTGYDEGRADAYTELLEQRTALEAAGRHARAEAPPELEAAAAPAGTSIGPWQISDSGAYPPYRAPNRSWTDAASIMPVAWPLSATTATVLIRGSQRGRYPDQNTGRLGKLTDTGEIRAITDEAIAAMRADNTAWLDKWGAGATA